MALLNLTRQQPMMALTAEAGSAPNDAFILSFALALLDLNK